MSVFLWILIGGLVMAALALVGSVTLLLSEEALRRILLPLVSFAAGNFVYIGASDLVPEVNRDYGLATNVLHFLSFVAGAGLLYGLRATLGG